MCGVCYSGAYDRCVCVCVSQAEIRRLSVANDELPELRKRMKSLEEKQECHDAALSQLQVCGKTIKCIAAHR